MMIIVFLSFGMTKNYIIYIEQPYVVKIQRVLAATMKDYAVKVKNANTIQNCTVPN